MTKTYTMPTWEEFVAMMVAPERDYIGGGGIGPLAEYVRNSMVRIDRTPYETIREALAVEGNRLTDAQLDYLVETASNIVRKAPMWTADQNTVLLALENLRHPELGDAEKVVPPKGDGPRYVPPESERLVGAARGEGTMTNHNIRCRMTGKVCGVSWLPKESNIEGDVNCMCGEECLSYKGVETDWKDAGGGEEKPVRAVDPEPVADHPRCGNCKFWRLNATFSCRRYPDGSNRSATEWCGEWRAK